MRRHKPRFSIVIPALNEEKYIGNTLECLRGQTFTDYEVIVVIDSATVDNTATIAEKYGVKIVFSPDIGLCPARDEGAKHAKGEILVSTDADTLLPAYWLEKINEEFKDENLVALSGATMPFDGDAIIRMEYIAYNLIRFLLNHIGIFHAPGYFTAIRREMFYRIAGHCDRPSHPYLDLKRNFDGLNTHALQKLGKTRISLSIWAFPSARRYRKLGLIKFNLHYSYVLDCIFLREHPNFWISLQKHIGRLVGRGDKK